MDFFLSRPTLLKQIGKGIALASLAIGVIGALVQLALYAFNNINLIRSAFPPIAWLDEVLPLSLIWWIPESTPGVGIVTCLVVAGFALRKLGSDIERLI